MTQADLNYALPYMGPSRAWRASKISSMALSVEGWPPAGNGGAENAKLFYICRETRGRAAASP